MNQNYRGLFENWEIGVATNVIKRYQNEGASLKHESFEDLLQECLIQWFYSQNKYDSQGGASKSTYMARIVTNKLHDIARGCSADKRRIFKESYSLDQPASEEEDTPIVETISNGKDFRVQSDLHITLSQAYSKLTPNQRKLCDFLRDGYFSPTDLEELMGVGRATVYREIERVKNVFKNEGLKDFLK